MLSGNGLAHRRKSPVSRGQRVSWRVGCWHCSSTARTAGRLFHLEINLDIRPYRNRLVFGPNGRPEAPVFQTLGRLFP